MEGTCIHERSVDGVEVRGESCARREVRRSQTTWDPRSSSSAPLPPRTPFAFWRLCCSRCMTCIAALASLLSLNATRALHPKWASERRERQGARKEGAWSGRIETSVVPEYETRTRVCQSRGAGMARHGPAWPSMVQHGPGRAGKGRPTQACMAKRVTKPRGKPSGGGSTDCAANYPQHSSTQPSDFNFSLGQHLVILFDFKIYLTHSAISIKGDMSNFELALKHGV